MIIVMEPSATRKQIEQVEKKVEDMGYKTHPIYGEIKTVIGVIGDKTHFDTNQIMAFSGVEKIVPIMKPYKLASKEVQEKSVVKIDDEVEIGGEELVIMAGPCAVEDKDDFYVDFFEEKS